MTGETRPPRVGVAVATSTSREAPCTPVSTTSSSHCTSPSTSCWSPAADQATHPSWPTASSSAWPSPRSCSATAPNAAGCERWLTGWVTCSLRLRAGRLQPPAASRGTTGRHHQPCPGGGQPVVVRPVAAAGCHAGPLWPKPPDRQALGAGRLGRLRLRRQPSPLLLGAQAVCAGLSGRDAGRLVPG